MMKRFIYTAIILLVSAAAWGAEPADSLVSPVKVDRSLLDERVIVGKDTVSIILPERNFSRYDRGLFNYLFIPKGQWAFGLTASYGEFDASDVQILQSLTDFNFKGKMYAIKPSVGYFFRNNQSIGVNLNYTRAEAKLGSLTVDIDEDINFAIRDVSYYSSQYSIAAFYRNYVGLGRDKRFAIFNEVALGFGSGSGRFKRYYDNQRQLRDTRTNITEAALNFSPGLCVFIMDYVSFNVSFGVFGLYLRDEKQRTTYTTTIPETETVPAQIDVREEKGSRTSSGANFRFNLFNINFGISVHI